MTSTSRSDEMNRLQNNWYVKLYIDFDVKSIYESFGEAYKQMIASVNDFIAHWYILHWIGKNSIKIKKNGRIKKIFISNKCYGRREIEEQWAREEQENIQRKGILAFWQALMSDIDATT